MCKFLCSSFWELNHRKERGVQLFQKMNRLGTASPPMCGFNPIWWSITCFFTSLPDRFQILILSSFIFWEKKCITSTNKASSLACVLHQLIFLLKKSDGLIKAPRHKILYTYTWSSKLSMHFILKEWFNSNSDIASISLSTFDPFYPQSCEKQTYTH